MREPSICFRFFSTTGILSRLYLPEICFILPCISPHLFQVESEASKRMESAAEAQGLNVKPWSPEEQQLLEQALKTYPSSLGTGRWDKIASCIPERSRKDCMKRYKELAEIVRAKKAAQAAAAAAAAKK